MGLRRAAHGWGENAAVTIAMYAGDIDQTKSSVAGVTPGISVRIVRAAKEAQAILRVTFMPMSSSTSATG
jgi:hypothetical protein